MKNLTLACVFSVFAFASIVDAATLIIIAAPGTIMGADAEHYRVGEFTTVVPGSYEVGSYLQSLSANRTQEVGVKCDGKFNYLNSTYYVFELKIALN